MNTYIPLRVNKQLFLKSTVKSASCSDNTDLLALNPPHFSMLSIQILLLGNLRTMMSKLNWFHVMSTEHLQLTWHVFRNTVRENTMGIMFSHFQCFCGSLSVCAERQHWKFVEWCDTWHEKRSDSIFYQNVGLEIYILSTICEMKDLNGLFFSFLSAIFLDKHPFYLTLAGW